GDRVWQAGLVLTTASRPKPFATMPLVWERAFGGTDHKEGQPDRLYAEDRNPIGAGFRIANGQKKLDGLPLPNLEDPRDLIASWKGRPAPVGFSPTCPAWEPRRKLAGTYDADWLRHRIPYLPRDFDPRFFQTAPPGLAAPGHFQGGEEVEVRGATPDGLL